MMGELSFSPLEALVMLARYISSRSALQPQLLLYKALTSCGVSPHGFCYLLAVLIIWPRLVVF